MLKHLEPKIVHIKLKKNEHIYIVSEMLSDEFKDTHLSAV